MAAMMKAAGFKRRERKTLRWLDGGYLPSWVRKKV